MRSSSGEHFLGLDHVRALAAFMVFSWHFCHEPNAAQFGNAPIIFPLALLDEGHTGVSLFMTLSGYLFAKLLNGKQVIYSLFIFNRALRLLPLLTFVVMINIIIKTYNGNELLPFVKSVIKGVVLPTLPNGGWSITAEFHFYLLMPFLLMVFRRQRFAIVAVLLLTITIRVVLYLIYGQVQVLSYWTIVGRIDQFVIGIYAFYISHILKGRHLVAIVTLVAFSVFYWLFDAMGGFYHMPSYPSPSLLWTVLPTIEGGAYAVLISYYDRTFELKNKGISWLIGVAGSYSYSIYLLHFYFVSHMASFVSGYIFDISNWYVAAIFAMFCFLFMVPVGYLSFRFIEAPFLRLRVRYTRSLRARLETEVAVRQMP